MDWCHILRLVVLSWGEIKRCVLATATATANLYGKLVHIRKGTPCRRRYLLHSADGQSPLQSPGLSKPDMGRISDPLAPLAGCLRLCTSWTTVPGDHGLGHITSKIAVRHWGGDGSVLNVWV